MLAALEEECVCAQEPGARTAVGASGARGERKRMSATVLIPHETDGLDKSIILRMAGGHTVAGIRVY